MALPSHLYSVVEQHMNTLAAMGLPAAAAEATAGNLIKAVAASPFGNIDLSAASKPANAFTEQYGAGPTVMAAPRQSSAQGR